MTSGMAMMYGGKAKPRKKLATGAEVKDTKSGKPNVDAMFRKIYQEFVGRSPSAAVLKDFRSKFQGERVTKQNIENYIDAGRNPSFRGMAKPPAD